MDENFLNFELNEIITILLSIITLIVTISIPLQIMKFQRYTNLMSIYMGFEFAHAFQSVINFFHDTCGCDVERISKEYKNRYNEDFCIKDSRNFDINDTLHYQRRLLNDFFLEIEMCRESSWILNKKIRKDWTTSEAYVCKILVFMNKAVDDDKELFKDISSIRLERIPKAKGINQYLIRLYNILKSESRNMQL